nr:MAG TPA: hypothetical protein [Caudoviricetes sp.]
MFLIIPFTSPFFFFLSLSLLHIYYIIFFIKYQ